MVDVQLEISELQVQLLQFNGDAGANGSGHDDPPSYNTMGATNQVVDK